MTSTALQRTKESQARLREKCEVIANVVIAIRPIHLSANPKQRALIETIVGAAIWYMPKPPDAWTGFMSKGALEAFHPHTIGQPRLSEEHVYPRKVAALSLLQNENLDGTALLQLFCKKYGRIHLITPEENKAVQQHQRSSKFTSPEDAYRSAGIILVSIAPDDLAKIKRRDQTTIENYLSTVEQPQSQ